MGAEPSARSWCKRPSDSYKSITPYKSGVWPWRRGAAATRNAARRARPGFQSGRGGGEKTLCRGLAPLARHVIGALERLDTLETKLGKLATELGLPTIKAQGYESKAAFIAQKLYLLKSYP